MIQKEKCNIKRVLALILSLACMIGMLAGCSQQDAGESNAEGSSSEEPSSDTWYEVDQEAGILTVRLPSEKEGFIWDFTINDTTLLELVTEEDNDGTFVASFRALGDGETVASFSYEHISSAYTIAPAESGELIYQQVRKNFPEAEMLELDAVLG